MKKELQTGYIAPEAEVIVLKITGAILIGSENIEDPNNPGGDNPY